MFIHLIKICQQFRLVRLRFYLQLNDDGNLPAFKGSLFHGMLGHALVNHDRESYHLLFEKRDNQQPKPYMIHVLDTGKTQWKKNEILKFELTLFGQATSLAKNVVEAVSQWGNIGLTQSKIKYNLQVVTSIIPQREQPGIASASLYDWLMVKPDAALDISQELALEFMSPIRLKVKGNILTNTLPSIAFVLNQIARRLTLLTKFWVANDEKLLSAVYNERYFDGEYELRQHLYYEDWKRYSLKQQEQLSFGGLMGIMSLQGEIAPIIPWLVIGEQLNIGGKTTFGLGRYHLIY
jgi:hypothetical protein